MFIDVSRLISGKGDALLGATTDERWPDGALFVINMAQARRDPEHAATTIVPAGCSPVRIALSPDGSRAYVTARNSNALLVYDTARLVSHPHHALIATVPVGTAPVGVAVVENGRRIVVANSNRFGRKHRKASLTFIDASRVTEGAGAVLGTLPAKGFPRGLRLTAGGHTLLVTDSASGTLELIDLRRLKLTPPAGRP